MRRGPCLAAAACGLWLAVARAEESPPPPPPPSPELLEFLGSWRSDDTEPAELLEMLELWPQDLTRKPNDE